MGLKKSVVVFGKYYDSVRNACKALNISYHTVQSAVKAKKYSHADALEILLSKIQDYKKICDDYRAEIERLNKLIEVKDEITEIKDKQISEYEKIIKVQEKQIYMQEQHILNLKFLLNRKD